MNLHLKRGLIAFLIAFGIVLIYGARDAYFDPPVDMPSVGYFAYWVLIKAIIAIAIGFGLTTFLMVLGGSWLVSNIKCRALKIGLVAVALFIAIPSSFLLGYQMHNTYTRCEYPMPPNR